MSLQTRLAALISAIGTDIKTLQTRVPPAGGTTNQVLSKKTNTDYDTQWATQAAANVTIDPWHTVGAAGEPPFTGGGNEAAGNPCQFRKWPDGRVQLRGRWTGGTGTYGIFTLPAGYKPVNVTGFTTLTYNNEGSAYVYVSSTGQVVKQSTTATFLDLSVIEFDTDTVFQTASVAAQPLEAWHTIGAAGEPTLGSGWSQVAGDTPIAFRKDINGRIAIKGMANAPAITANNFSVVFILPVGYRPPANTFPRFITIHALGSAMLRVESVTGEVRLYNTTGLTAPATGGIVALDVIEFDTETVSAYTSGVIGPQRVTVLPVGAIDGQEVYFVADATNGVLWHLRYNAASASAYKWEFVGGSSLAARTNTVVSVSTASYVEPSGSPTITFPLSGDYYIEIFGQVVRTGAGAGNAEANPSVNSSIFPLSRTARVQGSGFTAPNDVATLYLAGVVTAQTAASILRWFVIGGAMDIHFRELTVRPVRVA